MISVRIKSHAKRLVILAGSGVFFLAESLWCGILCLLGKTRRGTCVVFYYHEIPSGDRSRFARQMDMLLRHATPVRADSTVPLLPGGRYAVVTFDDGYRNVMENALPELRKRGIPSTWFIVSGAFDKGPFWLADFREASGNGGTLSTDELRGLPGLVTVGSHTATHPMLPSLSLEDARRELRESRSRLESILGGGVTLFSFPYGAHSVKLLQLCREAGYERVFTTLPGLAFEDPHEFVTGRVVVDPADWPVEFWLKLSGAYRWLPLAFSLKRRLRGVLRPVSESRSRAGAALRGSSLPHGCD